MSSAFVKEEEGQWLHDLDPTLPALINYLTRDNNGVRVYEKGRRREAATNREILSMSNGLDYAVAPSGGWEIVW
jgi:hypothetical protein